MEGLRMIEMDDDGIEVEIEEVVEEMAQVVGESFVLTS